MNDDSSRMYTFVLLPLDGLLEVVSRAQYQVFAHSMLVLFKRNAPIILINPNKLKYYMLNLATSSKYVSAARRKGKHHTAAGGVD
mmetsp:Transcript_30/g.32  ORF Transcript_30/g.32 Transcript_30/m.32 type:complete len:85 (-) Transcript_30:91-345(-)